MGVSYKKLFKLLIKANRDTKELSWQNRFIMTVFAKKGVAQHGFWEIRQPILHKIRLTSAFGAAGSGDSGLYAACGAPAVSDGHQRHQPGGAAGGRADAAL